jgi:hypothetical protein
MYFLERLKTLKLCVIECIEELGAELQRLGKDISNRLRANPRALAVRAQISRGREVAGVASVAPVFFRSGVSIYAVVSIRN